MPKDPWERSQLDLTTELVDREACLDVDLPRQGDTVAVADAELVVQRRLPASGEGGAPGSDSDLVDANLERLTGLGAADLDRPDQRVTVVELLASRLELATRFDVPAGIETGERNGVSAVDGQDRLQVAREVAVQRPALEWNLVLHPCGMPIHASRGARRTRRPRRLPSSKNSRTETACHSAASRSRATSAGM